MTVSSRISALLVCAFATACSGAATESQPSVVLVERNPWLMVIGSDSPSFALYSDGLVIFRDTESPEYRSTRLSEAKRKELLAEIAPDALLQLEESYTASEWTDQPTSELHVWVDGRHKAVSVYGALPREPGARAATPAAFLRAYDAIVRFSPEAPSWIPEEIEVLIWPYEYSPETPVPWPDGWPRFEAARPRGAERLHQVMLPAPELGRLQQLLKELKPKQAVELDKRKWAISYRFPLPREEQWTQ